ncbi:MAG: bifunctional hydroxymethylpyrimidine kinase/phosphomethylpyrimidine kinase [Candidatus Nealsonbacteria bacterium]|nr:bifunctional hydroxymethylpyrimidine kinase/phosphomethylpyrimidine kinase [Candidatus Nealsonbacteria bacterium]
MILSAGLTPAWQQILVFDGFRYGEVNRAVEALWCASGKVFNAGIAAHHLGGPSLTLAAVGGPPREQIEREFDALEVPRRFVVTRSATRVCTTILDRTTGEMTELVENGRPLASAELETFRSTYAEEAARAEVAVLIGSLPIEAPVSLYRELMEATPCPAVLDFRGEGLLSVLDLKPLVVKPNREELAMTVGRPLRSDNALLDAMRSLNARGARWVVVTEGAEPVRVTSASAAYRLVPPPADELVNPIGCGDCMAAGIAWAVRDGRKMLDAVKFGIAAAGENLRDLLPGRLDPQKVERRANDVRVESI